MLEPCSHKQNRKDKPPWAGWSRQIFIYIQKREWVFYCAATLHQLVCLINVLWRPLLVAPIIVQIRDIDQFP